MRRAPGMGRSRPAPRPMGSRPRPAQRGRVCSRRLCYRPGSGIGTQYYCVPANVPANVPAVSVSRQWVRGETEQRNGKNDLLACAGARYARDHIRVPLFRSLSIYLNIKINRWNKDRNAGRNAHVPTVPFSAKPLKPFVYGAFR